MTGDLPPELEAPRARFIAELGERISTLRQSLARFGSGSATEPAGELNALRRRVHALAAGADVLHFSRAAEALASAEAGLAGAGGWDPGAGVRERVMRILDLLPSLVLGAPLDLAAELDNPRLEPLREPLCVVVYADASLESLLHKPGSLHGIESHGARTPEQAIELVTQLSPDVLLVDGDDLEVAEVLPRLRQAAGSRQAAVVALGSFDRPEPLARLMRRGVSRVLPKPTDPSTLQRTLRQVTLSESSALQRPVNFRKLSSDELLEAIAAEARKAFRDPAAPHSNAPLDLGSNAEAQAALWGAFARLRSLASRHGEGVVSFLRDGPGGAILLAPDAPRAAPSSRPSSTPVPLHGRRLVVADDDPAVRTLLSNAFAELGATVLPARDGAEALDLAERHWPDALVSDTLMPQLDGFELCQRLRQDIALADLPVLLVAWKDHLLACTRAAGSGRALELLDGASLTLALRDCLATRAALEQRLAQHDAVHGRLDGLTPRLLLQMVCSRSPNALLSLRSGRISFEFSIADGRPVHARWYDGEASRGEGKSVLAPFLALRAGRFSVEPLFTPPPAHFEGDVMAVLNPAAVRARRARELVSPRNLTQVDQVLLDPLVTEHYAAEAPPTQAALLAQLGTSQLNSETLRRLAAEDPSGSEPGRLHALLADLARHGAIGALLDRDGRDLLPGGPAFHPSTSPPSSARSKSVRPGSVPAPAAPARASAPPSAAAPAPVSPSAADLADEAPREQVATGEGAREDRREPSADAFFSAQDAATAARTDPSPPPEPSLPPQPSPSTREGAEDSDRAPNATARAASEKRASASSESDDESESVWPPSAGARLGGALARIALSVGAAALAFVAIRALAFRSWDSQSVSPQGGGAALPASLPPLEPEPPGTSNSPPPLVPTTAARSDAGAARNTPAPAPVQLVLESELIELSPGTRLPPGQGALEVHCWQRQRIYIDGVLLGNDEERLIPLAPGTYQLRLSDDAHDLERAVEVKAGRRTRVSARPSSPP